MTTIRSVINLLWFIQFLINVNGRVCKYPVIVPCQSQTISVLLCLGQDPTTCTSTSQCRIKGVYDTVTDPNLNFNLIFPIHYVIATPFPPDVAPVITSYVEFQTNFDSFAVADNLYPLDTYDVAYNDVNNGPTKLYYNNTNELYVIDNTANEVTCSLSVTLAPTSAPTASPSTSPSTAPVTALPTTEPTFDPTTGHPTESPTVAPSVVLTEAPSALPTSEPTNEPTDSPTHTQTSSPTAAPVSALTDVPISSPTAVPSVTVSTEPTQVPTTQQTNSEPTLAPSLEPTVLPSIAITAAPTCAAVTATDQAYFTVTQQLSNLTSSYFNSSSEAALAFTDTVSAVLGCTAPTTVTLMGSSRRRLQLSVVPVTSVEYRIVFGYNGPPSAAYDALIAAINNAIVTGKFAALLRGNALLQQALQLLGASAPDLPTFSNYTLLPPKSKSNGSTSTAAPSNAGVIAGSVVAVLAALLIILLLVFCCRRAPSGDKDKNKTTDIEQAQNEDMHEPHKDFDNDAFNRANLFTSRSTMSIGSDKSLLEHYDEFESRDHGEEVPTRDGRPSGRVVIPLNLLPPTGNNRPGQPSADPSSRVPPLPGRQPRRSIDYSGPVRRGSRSSDTMSSASHTGTLADLDLALGRFGAELELERQRYHEEYDRGDDAHSQTSDGGSMAWDGASIMSGETVNLIEFPVPFRGDPLSQVNVQIGWHCVCTDGQYLVEVSDSPHNLTSFLLEGRHLKALNMPCTQVDSGFFHYASYDDLKGFVLRQLPFSATSCLGRYEDQILLMVTDVRHNLQKDASKKPLWRWVAKELTPDDTIQSGASILVIVCAKSTKL